MLFSKKIVIGICALMALMGTSSADENDGVECGKAKQDGIRIEDCQVALSTLSNSNGRIQNDPASEDPLTVSASSGNCLVRITAVAPQNIVSLSYSAASSSLASIGKDCKGKDGIAAIPWGHTLTTYKIENKQ